MAKTFSFTPLVLVVLTAAVLLEGTSATTYFVGDATGWQVPAGGASFYSNWAANKTFAVGDILVFNFLTGQHDVARVTVNSFGSCNTNAPISLDTVGPVNYTLNNGTGNYYFICTVGQHCLGGQKLNISVTSTSGPTASPPSSPPPSPTPSPPPTATPPTPASPAPGSPPPQSPSGTPPPSPPPPSGTAGPPTPPAASSPGSPPAGTTPPPPPPPPSSSSPPKAVAAFAFAFMSIVIGVMF